MNKYYSKSFEEIMAHVNFKMELLLHQCTAEQKLTFKRIYSHKDLDLPLAEVVPKIPFEKLDWAFKQIETTIDNNKIKIPLPTYEVAGIKLKKMKANKLNRDRLAQLKAIENDLQANIKTLQQKPANCFRFNVDADNNEQNIEELSDLLFSTRKLISQWETVYEID